jgi:hypothetical protein
MEINFQGSRHASFDRTFHQRSHGACIGDIENRHASTQQLAGESRDCARNRQPTTTKKQFSSR